MKYSPNRVDNFCIVNDVDRPCEAMIAEIREDQKLYYVVAPLSRESRYFGMGAANATPLSDFGLSLAYTEVTGGATLDATLTGPSKARYGSDRGEKIRQWQGSSKFTVVVSANPTSAKSTKA